LAPMATGMGGDAFLLFYEAETGSVLGANGSGRAPRAATTEKLRERGVTEMPERGGLTITGPGAGRLRGGGGGFSGPAPRAATTERLRERGVTEMPERGGLTITVPGAVRLWEDAVASLGTLP